MRQLVFIAAMGAALYLLMGQSNAVSPQTQQDGQGCADAYEYRLESWAADTLERRRKDQRFGEMFEKQLEASNV